MFMGFEERLPSGGVLPYSQEMTAKSSTLSTEIETLNGEIAADNEALDKSTEIRDKERADFQADEKNMIVSISGLKTAVMVLGQANDYSMSQEFWFGRLGRVRLSSFWVTCHRLTRAKSTLSAAPSAPRTWWDTVHLHALGAHPERVGEHESAVPGSLRQ